MIEGLGRRLRGSRFVRDSAVLQAASVVAGVASLASAFGLAFLLGPTAQGEFYLAMATWSFLWFFVNLGLYNVAASQVASAAERGNASKAGAWVAWLLKASLVIGAGATLLGLFALPRFCTWMYGTERVGQAAAILALTPLLELPRVALCAGLQGARRMAPLARVECGQELARVFLVLTGAVATGDPLGPAIGTVVASAMGSLLALDAYARDSRREDCLLPGLGEVRRLMRDIPVSMGMRLGIRVGLVRNLDAYGIQILPPMIIGVFGESAWVAYLRLAQRFLSVAGMVLTGVARTALSHFSGLVGKDDHDALESAYWRASLASGVLMGGVYLASLLVVPLVVQAFPPAYHDPIWLCYVILLPGKMLASFSVANDTFYLVTNTLKVAVILQFVSLGLVVGSTLLFSWLYPTFGAAVGLSLMHVTCLLHMGYIGFWFRRRRRAAAAAGQPGGAQAAAIE